MTIVAHFMPKTAKIFVAGHRGLVGSAICRELHAQGYYNVVTCTSQQLDLREQADVRRFFDKEKPEYVFLAAAKVGGIHANSTYPAEFVYDNLMIQSNIIKAAADVKVERLLFLGSTCIYPRECPQPMHEEHLLSGSLEPTNRPYAIAKIAGIELCWSFNRQYGTRFLALMPTNLYGPGDNYDLDTSHVIPAIIRKMHEAKVTGSTEVVLWGTGHPKREFLYSPDLAEAAVFVMNLHDTRYSELVDPKLSFPPLLNVGCGQDQTISELATLIAQIVGFNGTIVWDKTMPDGSPKKVSDVTKINALGWKAKTSLADGLRITYAQLQELDLVTSDR